MSLQSRIVDDLKRAMLAKDEVTTRTLRMVKADLLNRQVELGRDSLEDVEVQALLLKSVKSRQDSITQYESGGRAELAEGERQEIEIVQRYLPKALSEAEVTEAAKQLIAELGATSKKDMGRVMKELMARHSGQVDGKLASKVIGGLLP